MAEAVGQIPTGSAAARPSVGEGGSDGWALGYLALAVGVFAIACGPISDGDIYWHLAAGREMVRRHALLRVDPFTLSAGGRAWVDAHWMFQLAAYGVYRASGFIGLTILKAGMVAAGAVAAARVAARAAGSTARDTCAVALLGSLFLARHLLPIRPVILTLLFLTLFFAVLERARREWERAAPEPSLTSWRRTLRPLLLLPVAQIVWANCQGLSALGPVLVAAYLATFRSGGRGRALAVTFALCILASFVTPFGLDGARLPLRLFMRLVPGAGNVFSAGVAENVPPFILERTAPGEVSHFRWVLVGLAAMLVLARPRLPLPHALLLAAFAGLALLANRNVLLFYWVAAPILAQMLAQIPAIGLAEGAPARLVASSAEGGGESLARVSRWRLRGDWGRRLRGAFPLAALLVELVVVGRTAARETAPGAPAPFHFPVESVRRLQDLGTKGPVFAADQHGGYLDFMLPAMTPYIDTRLVLHTGHEYEDYLALFGDVGRFDALAAEEAFEAVILTTAHPDSAMGLIGHLAASPSWTLVHTDGYEVLFIRKHPGNGLDDGQQTIRLSERSAVDALVRRIDERFSGRPELRAAARLNLARLLVVVGETAQAKYVLLGLDSRPAVQLRARAALAEGQLGAAEGLARLLVDVDERDVRSLTLLAEIAEARGDATRAVGWVRRSLAIDPYDAEALALVDRLVAQRARMPPTGK